MADEKEKKIEKPKHSQPPTTDPGGELTDADVEQVAGGGTADTDECTLQTHCCEKQK